MWEVCDVMWNSRLIEVCDPGGTGFISLDYIASLAQQHLPDKAEVDKLLKQLDPRGKRYLTHAQFLLIVNSLITQNGWSDIMMAPSVGHQQRSQSVDQTQYYLPPPEHHHINHEKNDSHCSSVSDGESYECYGEVEMDTSSPNNVNGTESGQTAVNGNNLKRNTWFRTSLRRNGKNHETLPNRRWGSFRHSSGKRLGPVSLTGGLNRSSSFNSSGRSSTCDTADDVCSDISLEEDVLDLTHKVQMLQQQMNVLADNQNHSDERYTRAKQENATLQARIHMLEEQLREVEVRAEERLSEEERRHRELVARVDREKQLQVENCAIRLQTLELENNSLKEEATRCRSQADKLRQEKESLEDRLSESDNGLSLLREEVAILREQERRHKEQQIHNQQMMEELSHEIERLRGEQKLAMDELSSREGGLSSSAHQQLQEQLASLRQENKRLQEAHDEMQALLLTRSVEEGRSLLTENKSLAAELEAMSQDEVRGALKEQQEVNAQLRAYIDGMLLNIVENYPQLLEVKPNP